MKRRALLAAGGAWLAASAVPSLGQASKVPRRVAVLMPGTQASYQSRYDIFRAELRRLGHVEGRDFSYEARWGNNDSEKLASYVAELVALSPAVVLTGTSAAVLAFKKATSTIPIVFATAASPVEQGFASSLRRPGGNITGVLVHLDLAAKIVEIAREAMPKASRLGILVQESDPAHKLILDVFIPAAKRFKFEPVIVRATRSEDLPRAFDEIARQKADAMYAPDLTFILSHSRQIIEHSLKAGLPLFGSLPELAQAGALLSYGTTREENYLRAAAMVDKILRGAKPGELPIEQPERFLLVVNMKTAKAIGVKLPPTFLQRADKVIE